MRDLGARRWAIVLSLTAAGWSCGGDDTKKEIPKPSEAEVRAYMGMVPGNCWRYRLDDGTFANVSISGPDDRPIAGRSVYTRSYRTDAGNKRIEELFVFSSAPKMELARRIEGQGASAVTKTYDTDPLPLFGELAFDAMDKTKIVFASNTFKTTSTPKDLAAEDHTWTVVGRSLRVALHDGTVTSTAIDLSYRLGNEVASFGLVPGYGLATFTDFENRSHQVCAACVSDTPGGCTPAQCMLDCPR
jgi:hypothetical protein